MLKYFRTSFLVLAFGLLLTSFVAYSYEHSAIGIAKYIFIVAVLCVLEISLSFDNAVVNAVVLNTMSPVWKKRFLTWGMLIAVFGMRLIFPLLIVSVFGGISPWRSLLLAINEPKQYAETMLSAHLQVAAFGGSFLLLVGLKYFIDHAKETHWIQFLEKPLVQVGKIESIQIGLAIFTVTCLAYFVPEQQRFSFLAAGLWGIFIHILVDGISSLLKNENVGHSIERASAASFIYLEILDASFSFDGVIGAFAITFNLFVIMIGLSVGAFFVRSLTIYLVEQKTLENFKYLEHGAFYAILALAMMMLLDPFLHIPEYITGLTGAALIGISLFSSLRERSG